MTNDTHHNQDRGFSTPPDSTVPNVTRHSEYQRALTLFDEIEGIIKYINEQTLAIGFDDNSQRLEYMRDFLSELGDVETAHSNLIALWEYYIK